jgi:hypothetical protein
MKGHLVAMLFSDDISLEGLQQELEECKNDLFINASLFFSHCTFSPAMFHYVNLLLLLSGPIVSYVLV